MNNDFYTEIYDTKTQNTKVRPRSGFGHCKECKQWQGHEATCSQVTIESIASLLKVSREAEQAARDKAARWLEHLQRCTGKIAILKQENNQLRKANKKLREDRQA